jgi:O-antigen/teichoic acid export membrane protein
VQTDSRQAIEKIIHYSAWTAASMACGYLASIHLSRVLALHLLGELAFAQTIVFTVAGICDFGLTTLGTRELALKRENQNLVVSAIVSFRATISILVAACLTLAVLTGIAPDSSAQTSLIAVLGIWLVGNSLSLDWALMGSQRVASAARSRFYQQAFYLVGLIILVRGATDQGEAAIARAISSCAAAIVTAFVWRNSFKYIKEIAVLHSVSAKLKQSAPLFHLSLLQLVAGNVHILTARFLTSGSETGLLFASLSFTSVLTSGITLVNGALLPILASSHQENILLFKKTKRWYMVGACSISVCILLCIPLLSKLSVSVLGDQFVHAGPIIQVLSVCASIHVLNGAIAQTLIASGREVFIIRQIYSTVAITVVLSVLLAPKMGALGVALAYTIGVGIGTFSLARK